MNNKGYLFFHLNLMFSSIAEEQRMLVINQCYWPILQIAKELSYKITIEATVITLLIIKELDCKWIKELTKLISENKIEFIGSGYSQIIGPIVPKEVNQKNLELGLDNYHKIIGIRPKIFLINEMSF